MKVEWDHKIKLLDIADGVLTETEKMKLCSADLANELLCFSVNFHADGSMGGFIEFDLAEYQTLLARIALALDPINFGNYQEFVSALNDHLRGYIDGQGIDDAEEHHLLLLDSMRGDALMDRAQYS